MLLSSKDDPEKVKTFMKYWIKKLENEAGENSDFHYPKYLLRNTLSNQLFAELLFEDCLEQTRLNIHQIYSEVKVFYADQKRT